MIPFKNIFNKPTEFHLVIDNPHFTIPKDVELIKPKKTQYFCVNYTGNFWLYKPNSNKILGDGTESAGIDTGKLSVTVPRKLPGVSWVFYLKGVAETRVPRE